MFKIIIPKLVSGRQFSKKIESLRVCFISAEMSKGRKLLTGFSTLLPNKAEVVMLYCVHILER